MSTPTPIATGNITGMIKGFTPLFQEAIIGIIVIIGLLYVSYFVYSKRGKNR